MITTVEVRNIRCKGCAATINKVLVEEGFTSINIDLSCEPRKVTVDILNEASLTHFRAILRKLGYPFFDEDISFSTSTALKAKSFFSCAVGKFNIEENAN